MIDRPDNLMLPLVLHFAGDESGEDERTVNGDCEGQNGVRDHWQWTYSMWQQLSLSYAVVKVM